MQTSLPNFSRLRAVFYRERAAGFYSSAAYPLSLTLAEFPWSVFCVLLFLAPNYFLIGFKASAGAFFTAYLATLTTAMWWATIGAGMVAFFPVPLLAQVRPLSCARTHSP